MLNFWYNGEQIFYLRRSVRGNGAINVIEFGGSIFHQLIVTGTGDIYRRRRNVIFVSAQSLYLYVSVYTHHTYSLLQICNFIPQRLFIGVDRYPSRSRRTGWVLNICPMVWYHHQKSRSGLSVPPLWPCGLVSECRGRILYSLHLVSGQPASSPDLSVIITSLMSPVTLRGIQ